MTSSTPDDDETAKPLQEYMHTHTHNYNDNAFIKHICITGMLFLFLFNRRNFYIAVVVTIGAVIFISLIVVLQ